MCLTTAEPLDVVVVGGGPVGLYAGYRASLLHLKANIVDKGRKWGRGFHVPRYHNIPTHFMGMSGKEVIERLRKNIAQHPDYVKIEGLTTIEEIHRVGDLFRLKGLHHPTGDDREYMSRTVMLATGVVDRQPMIGGEMKNIFAHANKGLICYCVICDGHLAEGKNVAIIGSGGTAVQLASDVLTFNARRVTIVTHGKDLLDGEDNEGLKEKLAADGVDVLTGEIESVFGAEDDYFGVRLAGGLEKLFDIAFSALGLYRINNELAIMLGGKVDDNGYVMVDDNCCVLDGGDEPIRGLYAIGDLNYNWNQVMIGFGDADRAVIHAWAEYL